MRHLHFDLMPFSVLAVLKSECAARVHYFSLQRVEMKLSHAVLDLAKLQLRDFLARLVTTKRIGERGPTHDGSEIILVLQIFDQGEVWPEFHKWVSLKVAKIYDAVANSFSDKLNKLLNDRMLSGFLAVLYDHCRPGNSNDMDRLPSLSAQ